VLGTEPACAAATADHCILVASNMAPWSLTLRRNEGS
jgi:hypothetical protein